jgi:hypothetical protein
MGNIGAGQKVDFEDGRDYSSSQNSERDFHRDFRLPSQ